MNIARENLENLTTVLKVTVSEADYNEAVEKALREYKRKANIPGFRPGMVPMGVINKMYRKGAVAEESYRTASSACFKYLEDEKIDIVGDMMPSDLQQPLDFENATDHEFIFEVGIAPEVKIALTKKDKVTKHTIEIDSKMREGYRSNFVRRFGKLEEVELVEKEDALNVTLDQEEMQISDAYVGLISMNDDERAAFIGKKAGDSMEVDINELYKSPSQRASILSVTEEELAGINPKFNLTITKIQRFVEPELNDEFYKSAFPAGNVTNAEQFDQYIDEQIKNDLSRETEQLFAIDTRKFLLNKASLTLPEEFLKRWLFTINEGKFTMEDIEKDFAPFIEMMKWNIIQKYYVKELGIEVTEQDAVNEAKALAKMQFAYYGMQDVADDMLENYSKSILGNKEEARKIYDKIYETKVIEAVSAKITIDEKPVAAEDFGKLVQAAQ